MSAPRWAAWLEGRSAYFIVLGIAAALALPTCLVGFFLDDYAHLTAIDGRNPVAGPWNLYVFAPGDPSATIRLIEDGPFPWFTDPDLRVEFFRPLASLTMRLDRSLFGDAAWAYHLHCILWYLLLLVIVGGILRRALPGMLGTLTFLLFAVDEAHWFPVMWWSHRHMFVAAVFGFAALSAHLRWRENGWRPGMPLSLFALALGLLSGETALTLLGYFLAYELLAGPGNFPERARALMPALTLGVVYVAGYVLSGFGVQAGDCYISPVTDPITFLSKAPERFLILAAAQFFSWPAELPALMRAAVLPTAALGALALAIVGFALRAVWACLAPDEREGVAWLALGSLLALPPYLSPFTSSRLLLVSSVGGAAVIAVIIREAWRQRRFTSLGRILVALHLLLAPLVWLALSPGFAWLNERVEKVVGEAELDDTRISGQQCMLVSPADPVLGIYTPAMRAEKGRPEPAAWRPLSFAPYDHAVTRTAADAFELEVLDGGEMLGTLPESIARGAGNRLTAGTKLRFSEFDVTVLETGEYGPTRIAFRFRRPLEDPRYVWLAWREGRLQRFTMPSIGERVVLEWSWLV